MDEGSRKKLIISGLGRTLLISFLLMATIPILILSYSSYQSAYESLYRASERQLKLISHNKTLELNSYFESILADLRLESEHRSNQMFLSELTKARRESNLSARQYVKSYAWTKIVDTYSADLINFLST